MITRPSMPILEGERFDDWVERHITKLAWWFDRSHTLRTWKQFLSDQFAEEQKLEPLGANVVRLPLERRIAQGER